MNHTFHRIAEEDFANVYRYYEHEAPGKEKLFAIEIYKTLDSICAFPFAGMEIEDGIRRRVLKRFPYNVLYSVEPTGILILSIIHWRRDPNFWKTRFSHTQ